jgi:protein-S-isoprenylcysteine O-methyltransferase Ste14
MSEQVPVDRPSAIPWPPMILLGMLLAGFALGAAAPLPWPAGDLREFLFSTGLLMAAAAFGIDIWAARTFRSHNTSILPHRGATALITDGPYAYSRNPIYAGNLLLIVGVGLLVGQAWHLLLAPIAAVLFQRLAIEPEESHLEAKFGEAWQAYAAEVRRWV